MSCCQFYPFCNVTCHICNSTCHMWHYMSHVMSHVCNVTCHVVNIITSVMSHVISVMSHVMSVMSLLSHVTWASNVTCQFHHITCHFKCHMSLESLCGWASTLCSCVGCLDTFCLIPSKSCGKIVSMFLLNTGLEIQINNKGIRRTLSHKMSLYHTVTLIIIQEHFISLSLCITPSVLEVNFYFDYWVLIF